MCMMVDAREQRGITIAHLSGQVKSVEDSFYLVKSQSGNGKYEVSLTEHGWSCTCPDHEFRGVKCKHIWAVEISSKIKEQVKSGIVIEEVAVSTCIFCHSGDVKKFGVRRNKSGGIQRFLCRTCGKTFSVNIGFERMRHSPQAITSAMQLYFSGESLRKTAESLKLIGTTVSYKTIENWITKYVTLMRIYVEKIIPNVGDTWRADELYVKVKGDMKYLFALMDDETRFLIAQEVAESKYRHDARRLFEMGKRVTGKKPKTLITDGLSAYRDAWFREFFTVEKETRTKHIRHIRFQDDMNNNKMERLNGEIRDREKVMRGLKRSDTPILKGYQIYHNYLRPHEGLNGKTPAQACGIEIEGENKWITLIQNGAKTQNAVM